MPLPTLLQPKSLIYKREVIEEIPTNFILRKISHLYFEKNQNIFLLEGKTGSSKSTGFTISLFKYFKFMKKKIINLQPRVATVENIIEELTTEKWVTNMLDGYKIKLGEDIGYATGKMKVKAKSPNGIMYYTYGSYFEKLLADPVKTLSKAGVIVFDEVHEDNLELFLLLMKFKQFLNKGIKMPILILTSATFDIDSFKNYFKVDDDRVFYVAGGAQYHKEFIFLKEDSKDLKADVLKIIKSIPNDGYDILTFISSAKEIDDFKKIIANTPELKDEIVIGLNREVIQENKIDYQILYDKTIKKRLLIFGNETLETGVTLNNLKYVIILGWNKSNDYIPYFNSTLLYDEPSAKSSYIQRAGRVGRKFEGVVYNLFTEEAYNNLKPYKILSIFRMDISILMLYYLEDFDLIKIIPKELIYDAIYKLYYLGFIELNKENENEKITDLVLYKNIIFDKKLNKYVFDNFTLSKIGKIAQLMYIPMMSLSLNEIKFILTSIFMEINIFDIVTIIAMIKAYKHEKEYENTDKRNDFIFLLKEYKQMMDILEKELDEVDIEKIKSFKILENIIEKHKVQYIKSHLIEVINTKNTILNKLYEIGFNLKELKSYKSILEYNEDDLFVLNKCIYYSYFTNYVNKNLYRNIYVKGEFKKNFICNSFKLENDYLKPQIIVYLD